MLGRDYLPDENDRISQIRNEIARLFYEQAEFFKKGARGSHTPAEIRDYEARRQRLREVFAELSQLKQTA